MDIVLLAMCMLVITGIYIACNLHGMVLVHCDLTSMYKQHHSLLKMRGQVTGLCDVRCTSRPAYLLVVNDQVLENIEHEEAMINNSG